MNSPPFPYDINQQADWAGERLEAKAREAAERERIREEAKAQEDAAEAAIEKLGFWKRRSARARLRRLNRETERTRYQPHIGSSLYRTGGLYAVDPPKAFDGTAGVQAVRVFGPSISELMDWWDHTPYYRLSDTHMVHINLSLIESIEPHKCFVKY